MKKFIKGIKLFVFISCVLVVFATCQKDKTKYEVRGQNDMYNELLTVPFYKYNAVEFKLGGTVISDVPYGKYSEYVSVESTTDYEISVKVEIFVYDANTYSWRSSRTETYELSSVLWAEDETYTKQKIRLQIGDILQAYKPVYKVYGEE